MESPTTFLFNISVTKNKHQVIVDEALQVEPFHKIEERAVGPLGNRLVRLSVPPGDLTIRYDATVNLNADEVEATDVCETPYEQLPADVLTYLNPSRYCESDELLGFAMEQFGSMQPVFAIEFDDAS